MNTGAKPPFRREQDLYDQVARALEQKGYTVRGEVKGCDIIAVKGDEVVAIELKLRFNLTLLHQAVERQRMADSVYVAVPRPEGSIRSKKWRKVFHLLRRLELGLLFITPQAMDVVFHPIPIDRKRNTRSRRAVLREIDGRSADYNTGGTFRKKIVTAYREAGIRIACTLDEKGPLSPKELRELGTDLKTQSILYDNHYGWFERLDRGLYGLSQQGRSALETYKEITDLYRKKLRVI